MFLQLLLLFVLIPVLEISLLIKLGSLIGFWPTLAIVLVTAFLGAYLARSQGFKILFKIRAEMAGGQLPTDSIMEGLVILVAGLVLLTPGFLTDLFGLILLLPPSRKAFVQYLKKQFASSINMGFSASSFGRAASSSSPREVFSTYRVEKKMD